MRKIETQMNAALANSKNWTSGNTSVHYNEENNTSVVRLHGNKIAVLGDDFLEIFDGGWQTTTTKSRLNAIINCFCNGVTDGVFQKNYEWFVRDNNVVKEFTNGYIFAWFLQRVYIIVSPSARSPLSLFSPFSLSQMRLALTAIVVLLGANLVVDLLDSNLSDVINNRRETIERQINQLWLTINSK